MFSQQYITKMLRTVLRTCRWQHLYEGCAQLRIGDQNRQTVLHLWHELFVDTKL